MPKRRKLKLILIIILSLFFVGGGEVWGKEAPPTVREIKITGNKRVPKKVILSYIYSRPGDPYDSLKAVKDKHRVQRIFYIYNVELLAVTEQDSIDLSYQIQEIIYIPIQLDLGYRRQIYGKDNFLPYGYSRLRYTFTYFLQQDQELEPYATYGRNEWAAGLSWRKKRVFGTWFYWDLNGLYSSSPSSIYSAQFEGYSVRTLLGRVFGKRWFFSIFGGGVRSSVEHLNLQNNLQEKPFDQDTTYYAGTSLSYDARNRSLYPDRGYYLRFSLIGYRTHYHSGQENFLFTPDYARLNATYQKYFPLPLGQFALRLAGSYSSQELPHAMRTKFVPVDARSTFRGFSPRIRDSTIILASGNHYAFNNLEYRFPLFTSPRFIRDYGWLRSYKSNPRLKGVVEKLEDFYYEFKGFVALDNALVWGAPKEKNFSEFNTETQTTMNFTNLAVTEFQLNQENLLTSITIGINYILPTLGRGLSGSITYNDRGWWSFNGETKIIF